MDAVMFDMDGVIIDSERYWQEREDQLLEDTINSEFDPGSVKTQIRGMNYHDIYDFLEERFELALTEDEFVERFKQASQEIYEEKVELMPGFRAIVDGLPEGVDVLLVSSSPRQWVETVVDRFSLRSLFDGIVSAEDIAAASKPAPDIYLHAAERAGVSPRHCIAVEDSPNGLQSAAEAGMTTIAYITAVNRILDTSDADMDVEGPEALKECLERRVD